MKRLMAFALISTSLAAFGCSEAKTTFDPNYNPSEEEKQKIKAEDKLIEDEESHGTAGKAKSKTKAKR
jgi:hypothetical protein